MSRRYEDEPTRTIIDRRGRKVAVRGLRKVVELPLLGDHLLRQGQRIDHLGHAYLGDSTKYYKVVEANHAMSVEQTMSQRAVAIPEDGE